MTPFCKPHPVTSTECFSPSLDYGGRAQGLSLPSLTSRGVAAESWKQLEFFLNSTSVKLLSLCCPFWLHLPGSLGCNCLALGKLLETSRKTLTCMTACFSCSLYPMPLCLGDWEAPNFPVWPSTKAPDSFSWQVRSCCCFSPYIATNPDSLFCPQTFQASLCLHGSFGPVYLPASHCNTILLQQNWLKVKIVYIRGKDKYLTSNA